MSRIKCFAKVRRDGCSCLCGSHCNGYDQCPFYKNEAQYRADIKLAYMQLRRLPPEAQRAIAEQYYHGRMPWVPRKTASGRHRKSGGF